MKDLSLIPRHGRHFTPHFVGLFGVTFPVVSRILDAMSRRPMAIEQMPRRHQDRLTASLAWNLAEGLSFGLLLSIISDRDARGVNMSSTLSRCGFAEQYYAEREGVRVGVPVRPSVACFLPSETASALRRRQRWKQEYLKKTEDFLGTFGWTWAAANFVREQRSLFLGQSLLVNDGIRPPRLSRIDPKKIFGSANILLNVGAADLLRHDKVWWADFICAAIRRFAYEPMARWCCVRDPLNNLLISERTPNFQKWDDCAASLLTERIMGHCETPATYGILSEDVRGRKMNSARETARDQDEYALGWFDRLGLHDNPYTRWLRLLTQLPEQATPFLDWDWINKRFDRYVLTGSGEPHENDEFRQAKLERCLSTMCISNFPELELPERALSPRRLKINDMAQRWWVEVMGLL